MLLLFEIDFLVFKIFPDFPNCFNFDRFFNFFCFFKGVEIEAILKHEELLRKKGWVRRIQHLYFNEIL